MKNKKNWIIAVKIVAFVLLFCLMAEGLGLLVYPKGGDTTPKMVAFRNSDEQPELMLLGTSAVYNAVIPLKLEEITGLKVTDMCTPGQSTLSSLTLLRDMIQQGKIPDTIVMYTNIRRFVRVGRDEWDFQVMANLPMGLNKLNMLVRGFPVEEWPEAMLKAVRGRENFTIDMMREIWHSDYVQSDNAEYAPEEIRPYIGRGYLYKTQAQDPAAIDLPAGAIDVFSLDTVNRAYYDEIVALCRKHDIDLILFCIPRLPATIVAAGDYDGFHKYVTEIAAADGVAFWDLTYVHPELLEVRPDHFSDGYHANTAFALPFTELLGKMINEYMAGTLNMADYVYEDYDKYLQIHKGINAIFAKNKLDRKSSTLRYLDVQLVLGAETEAEFRMLLAPTGTEDWFVFRDWGTETRVMFPDGATPAGTYDVKIEARQLGGEAAEQTIRRTFELN